MPTSTTPIGTAITLPSLGENVTEATITRWLKSAGDRIEADEPLLEVATDKVDTEIPSTASGTVLEILVSEDAVIDIGTVVAIVGSDVGEPVPEQTRAPAESGGHHLVDRVEKLPRIRRTIARRMLESLQTSAQLTTVIEVDVTSIARLRAVEKSAFQRRTGTKLSFLPFFVAAAVEALAAHPVINSSLDAECTEVTYYGSVHLGMAVDSDKGLMVPVIREAESSSVAQLATSIGEVAERVRAGTIRVDDLSGGTFTITNTGSRGALFDTPIINQPQSAILGIGTVVERLVPARGETGDLRIDVRSMAYLSLSYDHRIVDGSDAARYLGTVRRRIEAGYDPAELM